MTATFKEWKEVKFNIVHRREDFFRKQFTAVVFNGKFAYDAVILRIYTTEARDYCVLWIYDNMSWPTKRSPWLDRESTGFAKGYGYNRESMAAEEAIKNASIELSESIGGRGQGAIEQAVYAIAEAMFPEKRYKIHVTEANP